MVDLYFCKEKNEFIATLPGIGVGEGVGDDHFVLVGTFESFELAMQWQPPR